MGKYKDRETVTGECKAELFKSFVVPQHHDGEKNVMETMFAYSLMDEEQLEAESNNDYPVYCLCILANMMPEFLTQGNQVLDDREMTDEQLKELRQFFVRNQQRIVKKVIDVYKAEPKKE